MNVLDRFLIRHACERDARKIAAIHAKIPTGTFQDGTSTGAEDPTASAGMWRDFLSRPGHLSLVATRGPGLVGFCSLATSSDDDESNRTAELTALFVDPEAWGSGVGRALMAEAVRTARAKGFTRLTHWVRADNVRGRDFCSRSGFLADGTERASPRNGAVNHEARHTMEL